MDHVRWILRLEIDTNKSGTNEQAPDSEKNINEEQYLKADVIA